MFPLVSMEADLEFGPLTLPETLPSDGKPQTHSRLRDPAVIRRHFIVASLDDLELITVRCRLGRVSMWSRLKVSSDNAFAMLTSGLLDLGFWPLSQISFSHRILRNHFSSKRRFPDLKQLKFQNLLWCAHLSFFFFTKRPVTG